MNKLSLKIFGASHDEKIGMELTGVPRGEHIDEKKLAEFMKRRSANGNPWSTKRLEPDEAIFERGVENGITTGDAIVAVIYNKNVISRDYGDLKGVLRPSHADYGAYLKFGKDYDMTGGGKFSGRMTAPLCIAGGIAAQILERRGVYARSYVSQIGEAKGDSYKTQAVTKEDIESIESPLCALSNDDKMLSQIMLAKEDNDSVGGTVDCIIFGLKGVGEAFSDGVESVISEQVFGIPAVKGIEFGLGFGYAAARGGEVNDGYKVEKGEIVMQSNNCGGILGGIAVNDVQFRVAFKPTPSIAKSQESVDVKNMENVDLQIHGRHDACIVPRAAVCVEAAANVAILDLILR